MSKKMYKIVSLALVMTLITSFLISAEPAKSFADPLTDTFENDTLGQAPQGYTVVGANGVVSNAVAYEGSKSLRIYDDSSSVLTNVVKTSTVSSAKVLEFMMYPSAAVYWNQIDINSGGNTNNESVFHIAVEADGSIKWYNGSTWSYIGSAGTVTFNAWNKIRIVAENTANADVYVNDNFVGTAGKWHTFSTMDRVRFMSGSTPGTGDDFYVDNVSFKDILLAEPASTVVGYLDSDTTPASGTVGNWRYTDSCVADYERRSLGIDCGQVMNVEKIELWDSDSSTRCTGSSYTLYWSNDNSSYTQITGVSFKSRVRGGRVVHSFEFNGVSARFYKINTTHTDSNGTFNLANLQLDVKAFGEPVPLTSTVGYLSNDVSPANGAVGNWGYNSSLAFDYQYRSVGIDLGSQTKVNKVELVDSDSSTRCKPSSYAIYWSNDNSSYTEISGVVFNSSIKEGRCIHSFDFSGITARYIKIHTTFSDTSSNFIISELQSDVKAYALSDKNYEMPLSGGYITGDDTPANNAIENWNYSSWVAVDNLLTSVGIDLAYPVPVNAVELWDTDSSASIMENNYTLYRSNDNVSYTQISEWTFSARTENGRLVHRFDFDSVNARYLKIHCNINNASSTFVLSGINNDIKAYSNTEAESYCEILDPQRNSEGDIISLKNGNLLMIFETYEGQTGDWDPSHLEGRISTDGGYTWGDKFIVLENEGAINTMKASLLRMENGDIALFYQVMDSLSDCKIYMRRSSDEGQTWGDRLCVTSSPAGYFIINGGRVIRLPSGRILVPVAYSIDKDHAMGGNGAISRCYYSDDDGYTWVMGSGYVQLPNGAIEPGVTLLKNGNILMNMRTRVVGKIYKAISSDEGNTWSAPSDMGFDSPSAPSTITRIPATGDLVIFWNNTFSSTNNPRNPLTIAISKDEGQSWINFKNMDEKNNTNDLFAYLTCRFIGRKALITYTENWKNKFRIVDVDWFYSN